MVRALLLSLMILLVGACVRNPATGHQQLNLVPESQEIQMGQQAAKEVAQSIGLYKDPKVESYVADLGNKLKVVSDRPNVPYTFQVVDDPSVNAFALPGGPVFVTRGILAHLTSEAELATVMGHEIGHVAARHSVNQLSKQELAQLGLGIGVLLSPTIGQAGQALGAGLNLLFLKFSREDENQADELGFRYAFKGGYDVRVMKDLFILLDNVSKSSQGGKLPEWLATHPNPENRLKSTEQRLAKVQLNPSALTVNRERYLNAINGITYGENPRQGSFKGSSFMQPELKFRLDFPQGWKTANQPQAVAGISPSEDALVELALSDDPSPQNVAQTFLSAQGVQAGDASHTEINGLPAITGHFQAETQQGTVQGLAAFIGYGGKTYALLGYTVPQELGEYEPVFRQTIGSFKQLTDPEALNAQPARLEIVKASQSMSLSQFNSQFPSSISLDELALINGLDKNATLRAGEMVKRVVGGVRKTALAQSSR